MMNTLHCNRLGRSALPDAVTQQKPFVGQNCVLRARTSLGATSPIGRQQAPGNAGVRPPGVYPGGQPPPTALVRSTRYNPAPSQPVTLDMSQIVGKPVITR